MAFKNIDDTKYYRNWYYLTKTKALRKTKEGRAALNKSTLKYRIKIKDEVIKQYGNKCVCCGEKERIFLAIDHINEDGAKHRKEIIGGPQRGGFHTYIWIRKNNFPNTFQVLCFNCNWAKSRGGCPHKR